MNLNVVGISHKTAPVELREKLAFPPAEVERIIASLQNTFSELVVLSTCNRTELYSCFNNEKKEILIHLLSNRFEREDLESFLYAKSEKDMISHLFSVASGLDSMVIGENEILKQIKEAYQLSSHFGMTGKLMNVLFQRALYVGKLVRTHTAISQGGLSVGSVAVSLAEKIFGDLSHSTVLIFGAGEMAETSARYLLSKKVKKLLVANRTLENARALAEPLNAHPMTLEQGFSAMIDADIVLTSVTAPEPLITKKFVEDLMDKRCNRSLFVIDIAVPRNVEPEAHQIDNAYLYNIDDLQEIVGENLKNHSQEIQKAEKIVEQKSEEFYQWYHSVKSGSEKSMKHSSAL